MSALRRYDWPGNVRQLRNVIERAVILAKGTKITVSDLPEDFFHYRDQERAASSVKPLKLLELQAITAALHECNGNKSKAARNLGISRKSFYKRLNESTRMSGADLSMRKK